MLEKQKAEVAKKQQEREKAFKENFGEIDEEDDWAITDNR